MIWLRKEIESIALEGSARQVEWGRSLRSQKISFLEKLNNRGVLKEIRPLLIEGELQLMHCLTPERLGWLASYVVVQACHHKDARFWIDSREQDPTTWLKPAFSELQIHCLSHPLFPPYEPYPVLP